MCGRGVCVREGVCVCGRGACVREGVCVREGCVCAGGGAGERARVCAHSIPLCDQQFYLKTGSFISVGGISAQDQRIPHVVRMEPQKGFSCYEEIWESVNAKRKCSFISEVVLDHY